MFGFMAQHKCKECHQEATKYSTYNKEFAFLCNSKKCDYKFLVACGYFQTGIDIKNENK